MKTVILLIIIILVNVPNSLAACGEIWFFIDDNSNSNYKIIATRNSANEPLFGINFMEVDTDIYDEVVSDQVESYTGLPPYDYKLGFDYLRDQGNYCWPFIGEGKLVFSIYRGEEEILVFRFKIDLVHAVESPDISFHYSYTLGTFTGTGRSGVPVVINFDDFINCWDLHNQQRNIDYYENDVELTNGGDYGLNNNIKIIYQNSVLGFPYDNYPNGTEFTSGTHENFWRGASYNLTTSYSQYSYNNILYKFRDWETFDIYTTSGELKIRNETDQISSIYRQTFPITVANNLEGGNGGIYNVTWNQRPNNPEIVESSIAYDGFIYNPIRNDIYSLEVANNFPALNTTWYFQKWNDGSINPTKSNIQITAPQTYTAFYKGKLRSNYATGFSSNSQRKVVGTDDGKLHMVYESLGSVWYTISTDGGTTWNQEQRVNPLGTNAKGVSITHDSFHRVYIVYQLDRDVFPNPDSGIVLTKYDYGVQLWAKTVYGGVAYAYDTKHVVSATDGAVCVVYKPSTSLPLWLRLYNYDGNEITANIQVGYTDATCINPSISAGSQNFCLAYQSGTTSIKYVEINGSSGAASAYQLVTRSGPFTYNINPSISTHSGNSVVSWSGYNSSIPTATVRRKSGGSWSSFSLFDNGGVAYPTNNNSHRSGTDGSIIAWYNMYNQPRYVKFSNGSFSSIMSISSSYVGRDIQVSDGSNFSNIKAIAYNGNTSLPYVVMPLAYDFNLMQKINGEGIFNYARLAVVSKDNSEIVYGIGDVKLDGKNIRFTPESDMIKITDAARLTSAMATESFSISSAGKLEFSECAYVIKRNNDQISTSNINPIIELVNSNTGKAIKVKDIAFEEKDTIDAKNFYLLDCRSLASGEYYLRVKLDTKEKYEFCLSDCIYEENKQLPKKHFTEITSSDNSIPKEYSLEQNYPNPFNPTTTINYQIKEDGIVTLKLYDVLGEEIQTLVNEGKVKGRYGYTFDGSDLPSGVYVYQLKVNDFSSSKKLMLVK